VVTLSSSQFGLRRRVKRTGNRWHRSEPFRVGNNPDTHRPAERRYGAALKRLVELQGQPLRVERAFPSRWSCGAFRPIERTPLNSRLSARRLPRAPGPASVSAGHRGILPFDPPAPRPQGPMVPEPAVKPLAVFTDRAQMLAQPQPARRGLAVRGAEGLMLFVVYLPSGGSCLMLPASALRPPVESPRQRG
jgi:hypothetical protein